MICNNIDGYREEEAMRLTHFSLCSGIGGIDLAAEWAGFETIGQCELNEYASRAKRRGRYLTKLADILAGLGLSNFIKNTA